MKKIFLLLACIFAVAESRADATQDLFTAVYKADEAAVKKAIGDGADVNGIHQNGFTPLLLSMWYPGLTKVLIEAKADVNKSTHNNQYTPLSFACAYGSVETVKLLVDAGANVNARTTAPACTPYLAALGVGRLDLIDYLESKGADMKVINDYNQDALMVLANASLPPADRAKLYKTLEESVIKAGNPVPPNIIKYQDASLYSTFDRLLDHFLAKGFNLNTETVVKVPANFPNAEKVNKNNEKDDVRQSALSLLFQRGNGDLLLTAFQKGGDVTKMKAMPPFFNYHIKVFMASTLSNTDLFFHAVRMGNVEVVKYLLGKGVGNVKQDYEGWFFTSLCNKQFKIKGFTPLMIAANEGNLAMCKFLVEQGAKKMDKCTLDLVGSKDSKTIFSCGEYLVKRAMSFPENFTADEEVKGFLKK